MWAMMRALATRHLGWAALAGLAAAAAMLTKYWSVFLLAALAFAALADPRRVAYFRSAAPWVTAGVFLAAVAPHAWWLVRENFPPITWVTSRRFALSTFDLLRSFGDYAGRHHRLCGRGAPAGARSSIRPSRAAIADSWFPRDERRGAAILFWTPLLLPFVPALIKGISLLSLWNTPALNLLPVMTLGFAARDRAARRGAAHRRGGDHAHAAHRRGLAGRRLRASSSAASRTTPPMRAW